jgi:hypothetical protein
VFGRLNPSVVASYAGLGADSADDGVSSWRGALGLLNHQFEGATEIVAATGEEADGMGMAVDACPRVQLVVVDDRPGGMPIDEFPLDGVAFRVTAYLAFASMACRIGRRAFCAAGAAFFIILHNTQRDIMRGRSAQGRVL